MTLTYAVNILPLMHFYAAYPCWLKPVKTEEAWHQHSVTIPVLLGLYLTGGLRRAGPLSSAQRGQSAHSESLHNKLPRAGQLSGIQCLFILEMRKVFWQINSFSAIMLEFQAHSSAPAIF